MIELAPQWLTQAQRKVALKRARAMRYRQEEFLLGWQGYVVDGLRLLNRDDIRTQRLNEIHRRLTRVADGNRPANAGHNAARAADIVKRRAKSTWWHSRGSNHAAGDDHRGIARTLCRWARQGRIKGWRPVIQAAVYVGEDYA